MKRITLRLKNYYGFKLRQINNFVYRPREKTQVILGSNGSGKSSLLKELSPLPGVPSDYVKGGKKEIEFEHNGKHYLLQSLFEKEGNQFNFIVDGENLNPGRTVTVYRELVKEHFNYTSEVHALMTGRQKFTTMSVAERRKWFTTISTMDYTYALQYHQKLKEKIRALQGALDRTKARLTQETAKCLSTEEEARLREAVKDLHERLASLLERRRPRVLNPNEAIETLERLENDLERDMGSIETLFRKLDTSTTTAPLDALEERRVMLQTTLQISSSQLGKKAQDIESKQQTLNAILKASSTSIDEIDAEIRSIEEEINLLYGRIRLNIHTEDVKVMMASLDSARPQLEVIAEQFAQLPRLDYKTEDYRALLAARPSSELRIKKISEELNQAIQKKRHLELHREKDQVVCPKCQYGWHPGYDEVDYQKTLRQCAELESRLNHYSEESKRSEKLIDEHKLFFETSNRYAELRCLFPALSSFWSYIDKSEKLTSSPTSVINLAAEFSMDLQYALKIEFLNTKIAEQKKLRQSMKATGSLDREKLEKEIQEETEALRLVQVAIRERTEDLHDTQQNIETLRTIEKFKGTLKNGLTTRNELIKGIVLDQFTAVLDEIIYSLRTTLSQHERSLSQIDVQKALVRNLASEIEELQAELRLLKLAQKSLSPTGGLIAKGMTGFINHFLEQMNRFIEKIWLYPLELTPVTLDDDDSVDLNYRFGVLVNHDHRVDDISLTSRGMQEVISLAFVAVSMRYLGLSNFPIFLDEFAATFDHAHRQMAYKVIDYLIDSTDYSQVFLVSHYQDGYSNLSASEVLVLCDSNVELPSHLVYNQHVEMT